MSLARESSIDQWLQDERASCPSPPRGTVVLWVVGTSGALGFCLVKMFISFGLAGISNLPSCGFTLQVVNRSQHEDRMFFLVSTSLEALYLAFPPAHNHIGQHGVI